MNERIEEQDATTEKSATEEEETAPEEAAVETEEGETEEQDAEILEEEIEEVPSRWEEEEEEVFVEEKIYTIPLQRAWIVPAKKRAPKAIRIIKAFIQRHMKVAEESMEYGGVEEGGRIIISNEVNEEIWSRGIQKPPRKLRVRAAKDEEGNVTVFLA